jgi:uncharacterized protein (DUF1778 family)
MTKEFRLFLRLTELEKEQLRDASKKTGVTMTEFVRWTCLNAAALIASGNSDRLEDSLRSTGVVLMARTS